MKYKEKRSIFDTEPFDLILKLKVTKQIFFGQPNYDFLYVGNVHKNSILENINDIEHLKIKKFPQFFKKLPHFVIKKEISLLF